MQCRRRQDLICPSLWTFCLQWQTVIQGDWFGFPVHLSVAPQRNMWTTADMLLNQEEAATTSICRLRPFLAQIQTDFHDMCLFTCEEGIAKDWIRAICTVSLVSLTNNGMHSQMPCPCLRQKNSLKQNKNKDETFWNCSFRQECNYKQNASCWLLNNKSLCIIPAVVGALWKVLNQFDIKGTELKQ